MKNNMGFTLVELLAVIVIMGILMMVAIPSVTRTIENSRKDTFVDIAKSYGNAARNLWTTDNLTCDGVVSSAVDDGDYYILINSKEGAKDSLPVLVDQGGKSSWGNRDVNGYVRVNISTTPGEDTDGDGEFDVEPKRLTKFYVSLSDGTHGILDNDTLTMDELVRGNVNMTLSDDDLKKIELTVDDGRLDCGKSSSGRYSCAEIKPVKKITGVCVDDQTNVGLTGRVAVPVSFENDDWDIIIDAINSGTHPYHVGDTKTVDMGSFGTHTVRLANLSKPSECSTASFSQTACGTVIEFVDIITNHNMNPAGEYNGKQYDYGHNRGGWPNTKMREYINNTIYNAIPRNIRDLIIDTYVISNYATADNSGTLDNGNFESTDKLYLLSAQEIYGTESFDSTDGTTRQLDFYSNNAVTSSNYNVVIKKNGSNVSWWYLRSAPWHTSHAFGAAKPQGIYDISSAANSLGVSPAFRIG